jgi:putative toxin-antitoxin system antitoxin component (TIGR02293 family)
MHVADFCRPTSFARCRRCRFAMSAHRVVDLLGGAKVFGHNAAQLSAFDPLAWDQQIVGGVPIEALENLLNEFRLPRKALLASMGLNPGWLQRQRRAGKTKLDPIVGARVVAVAHLVCEASRVLGSPVAAERWLTSPKRSLAGAVPLELAGRHFGHQAVLERLIAIDHGFCA